VNDTVSGFGTDSEPGTIDRIIRRSIPTILGHKRVATMGINGKTVSADLISNRVAGVHQFGTGRTASVKLVLWFLAFTYVAGP
jgi:hypothetical protein